MQLTFRWYGESDPVTLGEIRQIPGMKGIVSALHDRSAGEVWPLEDIVRYKRHVESFGLQLSVIESIPVHEAIKMGLPSRDEYLDHYRETLRNLAQAGVSTVCYNFMPLFDWLRTAVDVRLPDGSTTMAYNESEVDEAALLTGKLRLPAWNITEQHEELNAMYAYYRTMPAEQLWRNLNDFIQAVMPVARECGVNMAIHPDDPPWPVLGLPRIIGDQQGLERLTQLYDDPCNGICFCSGSLGANPENRLTAIVRHFGSRKRIHFVHLRNVKVTRYRSFYESGHLSQEGSVDMYSVVKALHDVSFAGPVRPDHGRMIWGETGNPGYGLYDRALGAAYVHGLWEAVSKGGEGERYG